MAETSAPGAPLRGLSRRRPIAAIAAAVLLAEGQSVEAIETAPAARAARPETLDWDVALAEGRETA